MSDTKKRGPGRNKSRVKKREYQAHCRVMRTSGHVTGPDGGWTTNKSVLVSDVEARFKMTTLK